LGRRMESILRSNPAGRESLAFAIVDTVYTCTWRLERSEAAIKRNVA